MEKNIKGMTRRERRRSKQYGKQTDSKENKESENVTKKQNAIGTNKEPQVKPRRVQVLGRVVRKDTFTLPKRGSLKENTSSEEGPKTYEVAKDDVNLIVLSDMDDSKNMTHTLEKNSSESKNLTYQLEKELEESLSKSKNYTYEVNLSKKSNVDNEPRPVPAPRRQKPNASKTSSDTDKDIMDIEFDDNKDKEEEEESIKEKEAKDSSGKVSRIVEMLTGTDTDDSIEAVILPKPKPRRRSSPLKETRSPLKKSKSFEALDKEETYSRDIKSDLETGGRFEESDEDSEKKKKPLVEDKKSSDSEETPKSQTQKSRRFAELLDRKNKKKKSGSMFSSMMRLERARLPKISSILRDLKEDVSKENRLEQLTEEDRTDFQMDSPRIPEPDSNGRIYVQNKNGFYVKSREEVFKTNSESLTGLGDHGNMEDSTIKTAVLFHKYWSRLMIYFHGLLAGFALFHAVTVTALMVYHKHEAKDFVDIYSSLALKIHFIFYTLITLCIISCFDRLDVGHLNKKHFESAWKLPSMWIIISIYVLSFILTFVNHKTETRFDAYQYADQTDEKLWDSSVHEDLDSIITIWYRMIWTRDMSVLVAWLLISLTQYTDFLYLHLVNMIKYTEVRNEGSASQKAKSIFSLT